MTVRSTRTRRLERQGFVHVSGWVRKKDAPAIIKKIEAARDDVDAVDRGSSDVTPSRREVA